MNKNDLEAIISHISELSPYEQNRKIHGLLKGLDSVSGNGEGTRILRKPDGTTLGYFDPADIFDLDKAHRNGSDSSVEQDGEH